MIFIAAWLFLVAVPILAGVLHDAATSPTGCDCGDCEVAR